MHEEGEQRRVRDGMAEQGNPVHAQVLVDEPPDGEREHHPQHDEGVLVLEAELGMRPVRVVLVHLFAVLLHGGHGLGQADHCRPCDEQDDVGLVGRQDHGEARDTGEGAQEVGQPGEADGKRRSDDPRRLVAGHAYPYGPPRQAEVVV